MSPYRTNIPEFKALEKKYKSEIGVRMIIDDYQKLNNTDAIPSVDEAEAMIKTQINVIKSKSAKITKTLISNLENKGYIRNVNGKYNLLVQRYQIEEFLKINKFPLDVINYVGDNVEFVSSNAPAFLKAKDVKPTKRTRDIVNHLGRMFPGVNIQVLDSYKAEKLYDSLPDKQKMKDPKTNEPIPFERVNSFFVNGTAVLVNGKLTDEIAAEEILHPFVESLLMDKNKVQIDKTVEVHKELNISPGESYEAHTKFRHMKHYKFIKAKVTDVVMLRRWKD